MNEARVDYVRADGIDEAISRLAAVLQAAPAHTVNALRKEAARFLERMGMPQVCPYFTCKLMTG